MKNFLYSFIGCIIISTSYGSTPFICPEKITLLDCNEDQNPSCATVVSQAPAGYQHIPFHYVDAIMHIKNKAIYEFCGVWLGFSPEGNEVDSIISCNYNLVARGCNPSDGLTDVIAGVSNTDTVTANNVKYILTPEKNEADYDIFSVAIPKNWQVEATSGDADYPNYTKNCGSSKEGGSEACAFSIKEKYAAK